MSSQVLKMVWRRDVGLVARGLLLMTAVAAVTTGLLFAHQARALLAVHFTRIPVTAGDAASIWLHNLRSELGVAVFAVVDPVSSRLLDGDSRVWRRLLVGFGDVVMTCWAVGSSLIAGVLLGAYGMRKLAAFLPDGPVEVTAWALLLALYINARRGHDEWRQTVWGLVSVEVLLALAAILEAWGSGL